MEVPAELQGYVVFGTAIAAVVVAVLSYVFKKPENPAATLQGAAIIDSSVGRDLVEAVERVATATEATCSS